MNVEENRLRMINVHFLLYEDDLVKGSEILHKSTVRYEMYLKGIVFHIVYINEQQFENFLVI